MREEQERADDRRDAAREIITFKQTGKLVVRFEILLWQFRGRCHMRLSMLLKETLISEWQDMRASKGQNHVVTNNRTTTCTNET